MHHASVTPKIINACALRPTRSEENLQEYFNHQEVSGVSFNLYPCSDNDNECWTPEDDEITMQVVIVRNLIELNRFSSLMNKF